MAPGHYGHSVRQPRGLCAERGTARGQGKQLILQQPLFLCQEYEYLQPARPVALLSCSPVPPCLHCGACAGATAWCLPAGLFNTATLLFSTSLLHTSFSSILRLFVCEPQARLRIPDRLRAPIPLRSRNISLRSYLSRLASIHPTLEFVASPRIRN